jgi:glycopeptide antibiotics resistance protein
LGLYALLVARLTLEGANSETVIFDRLNRVAGALSGHRLKWAQTEVLANIALFVPLGFLLAVVLVRVGLSVALCVTVSVLIELMQYRFLPSRTPTIDDVWHNGVGGVIGAVMAVPLNCWLGGRSEAASRQL